MQCGREHYMDVNVALPSEDEGDEPVPPQVSATQKWDCDVPDCTFIVKGLGPRYFRLGSSTIVRVVLAM